ncbi:hypothetical protein ACH5RR_033866 [Cinchona calisaya]|uniref:Secreted protein n=1 Tax=Cinchona calisaya TaxID=153742 RepID=A0ABD2YDW3_9GENT
MVVRAVKPSPVVVPVVAIVALALGAAAQPLSLLVVATNSPIAASLVVGIKLAPSGRGVTKLTSNSSHNGGSSCFGTRIHCTIILSHSGGTTDLSLLVASVLPRPSSFLATTVATDSLVLPLSIMSAKLALPRRKGSKTTTTSTSASDGSSCSGAIG